MEVVRAVVVSLALGAGGCSTVDFKPLGSEDLRNSQGHVIGYRERLCDCAAGEELDRVVLFTPRYSERGAVIAYEERVKGGAVLRDLSGKRIGNRWVDLRSRGSNAHSGGLTIVFVPKKAERIALASVTIEEIKQHLRYAD
jgi:hypothetical protein